MTKRAMLPSPEGGRSIPEWIGKTPDSAVPNDVKLRVLKRYGFKCYLSGRLIQEGMAWQVEHVQALHAGGENRESNLAPALAEPHKVKTAEEARIRAWVENRQKSAYGLKPPNAKIPSRPKLPKEARDKLPIPSPRPMFVKGPQA